MLFAIVYYGDVIALGSWEQDQTERVFSKLNCHELNSLGGGQMQLEARLMPTSTAVTVRNCGGSPQVIDGPSSDTPEDLLGVYILDCPSLEAALSIAQDLASGVMSAAYELRPVRVFKAGNLGG